jgi:hypothetical protein
MLQTRTFGNGETRSAPEKMHKLMKADKVMKDYDGISPWVWWFLNVKFASTSSYDKQSQFPCSRMRLTSNVGEILFMEISAKKFFAALKIWRIFICLHYSILSVSVSSELYWRTSDNFLVYTSLVVNQLGGILAPFHNTTSLMYSKPATVLRQTHTKL